MNAQIPLPRSTAAFAELRCMGAFARLLARQRIHMPRERLDMRLRFANGTTGRVYRETTVDRDPPADPCVLVVEFRLRAIRGDVGHRLFRAESLLNTPLFVGYPGYVSKLWLAHDEHGVYPLITALLYLVLPLTDGWTIWQRTLVIAPKGLVSQWVSEMRFHFGESFQLVLPEDIKTLKRIAPAAGAEKGEHDGEGLPANAWQVFSQVVVPMDSVKPLDKRRGWSAAQVSEHNRERFEDLVSAGWDLVIVDEAHRLGGSTDQVSRFKLGQGLSEAAPYFLLLSATPHQGKTDAFHRLVSLIDAQAFPDVGSVTRDRVQPYVIRTEKRRAIDAEGRPLFKPRHTQLATVSWEEHHRDQEHLYEAVTEYVRDGYNQAIREKRSYIGFLMILMQRVVVPRTRAIWYVKTPANSLAPKVWTWSWTRSGCPGMSSNGVPCRSYDGTRETSAPVLVVVWRTVADFVVECPRSLKRVFGTEGCRFESCRACFLFRGRKHLVPKMTQRGQRKLLSNL